VEFERFYWERSVSRGSLKKSRIPCHAVPEFSQGRVKSPLCFATKLRLIRSTSLVLIACASPLHPVINEVAQLWGFNE
jgi:hypothetical protein